MHAEDISDLIHSDTIKVTISTELMHTCCVTVVQTVGSYSSLDQDTTVWLSLQILM